MVPRIFKVCDATQETNKVCVLHFVHSFKALHHSYTWLDITSLIFKQPLNSFLVAAVLIASYANLEFPSNRTQEFESNHKVLDLLG